MDRNNSQETVTPENTHRPGDPKVAARLAQGLALVPYYAQTERGVRSRTGSARDERKPQDEYAADREGSSNAQTERGVRTAYCVWIKLRHGESISQAAARLSEAAGPTQTLAKGNVP